MIQALFCFSSARRRGQDDGWRWLPRRDKTARLSRHNRSVRLLARPGGHGRGRGGTWAGAGVLLQPQRGRAAAPRGAHKRHDFCKVLSRGVARAVGRNGDRTQVSRSIRCTRARARASPCSAAGRYGRVSWLPAVPAALAPPHRPKIHRETPARGAPYPCQPGDAPGGIARLLPPPPCFPPDLKAFSSRRASPLQ